MSKGGPLEPIHFEMSAAKRCILCFNVEIMQDVCGQMP